MPSTFSAQDGADERFFRERAKLRVIFGEIISRVETSVR
jgi:hypothetical protein